MISTEEKLIEAYKTIKKLNREKQRLQRKLSLHKRKYNSTIKQFQKEKEFLHRATDRLDEIAHMIRINYQDPSFIRRFLGI